MKKILNKFIDFLFPMTCISCKKFLITDELSKYMCNTCYGKLKFIQPPICQKCGVPVNFTHSVIASPLEAGEATSKSPACGAISSSEFYCPRCRNEKDKIYYDALRGILFYEEPIKECIHLLKYSGKEYIKYLLGELLQQYIQKNKNFQNIDFVVPVPIHWTRKLKRGYNQSELLSGEIVKKYKAKHDNRNLFRKKNNKGTGKT